VNSEKLTAFQTAKANLLTEFQTKQAEVETLKSELLAIGFTEDDLKGKSSSRVKVTEDQAIELANKQAGHVTASDLKNTFGCSYMTAMKVLKGSKKFTHKADGNKVMFTVKK
jgi:hypothetical protein